MAIVYISHRLEEVITIGDRITVLRDGELITTMDNSDKNVSKDEIVAHIWNIEVTILTEALIK